LSDLAIPKIECVESEESFGRFLVEPLEKGFGITLGNALRRVLLGYLPGAAVTAVKIEGIHHEFSIIPHVKEDTTEFLLNVKALRLKSLSGQPGKLTLEVEGAGQACAADINPSTDFEIANPELYLATLDSPEARLYVEFDVELGIGYKEAESSDNLPVGTIPVDSIFTPTRKVNFTIEPTHIVGQEISRERLSLEIWTDGTISSIDALSHSAEILIKQLSPFAQYAEISLIEMEKQAFRLSIPEEKYNMPVEQLDLSVRTINCLRRASITTVGELISKEEKELLRLRNFGQKSSQEINERLKSLGLSLSPQVKDLTMPVTEETEGEESVPPEDAAETSES
jgi:DNA-directed RNA polymerase subunit alpha